MNINDTSKHKEKTEIQQQMIEIYKTHQGDTQKLITSISYYNKLAFPGQETSNKYEKGENLKINTNMARFAIDGALAVTINLNGDMKNYKIELFYNGKEIGMIDENSTLTFLQDFLQEIKEHSEISYKILQQANGKFYEMPVLEEIDESLPRIGDEEIENFALSKEELELLQEQSNTLDENQQREAKDSQGQNEEKAQDPDEENKAQDEQTQNQEEQKGEEDIAKIAKSSGLTKDDIKSCSTINPKERITDSESFEDIANVAGQYTKIFVVSSNRNTEGNSRFAFWGLTPDGRAEQIPGLEERDGVNTGKSIYSINRDGSRVTEQQTSALFTLPNGKEGFSVTIGQYGVVETTYIRKSPEENKFIGSSINSTTQKPTTREVQEFMNDSRTTDKDLQKTIQKAEHQLNETDKTHIRNIDNKANNDVAIDIDAEIKLHDETVTTLRREAEKLGMTPEEYRNKFEETKGDCFSDKIEAIRIEHGTQDDADIDVDEGNARADRGERLTPEEEALKKLGY